MNEYRWFNPSQPQTLQFAVVLSYVSAAIGLLTGAFAEPLLLLILAGLAAGAFGIANEKKWGYALAVASAGARVLLYPLFFGYDTVQNVGLLIDFMFAAALFLLLVHPMSRDYQRIWFK